MGNKKGSKWGKGRKYEGVERVPVEERPAACLALIKANPGQFTAYQLSQRLGLGKSDWLIQSALNQIELHLGVLLVIDPDTEKYNWVRTNPPAQCLLARCPLWPMQGRRATKPRD